MVKTRRNHRHTHKRSKTMNAHMMHEKECEMTTFHGLQEWMECKFEKLGWMILAKKKGYTDKVREYLHSLHRLHDAIEHKMLHMRDMDKRDDLEIMLHNVHILCEHAEKDLK